MKTTRTVLGRLLVALSLAGAAAATTSCGPLSNNESAALLVIEASSDFRTMVTAQTEAFRVTVSEGVMGTLLDEVYDNTGGWPTDPTRHSLLLIAAVEGNTRTVTVNVWACDNNQCNATLLGSATTKINFRAGEQVTDVVVFLEP